MSWFIGDEATSSLPRVSTPHRKTVADSADYRCCAVHAHAGICGYAPGTPSGEKEKRAKRIWAEADWREGGAAAVGTQDKRDRDRLAGVG